MTDTTNASSSGSEPTPLRVDTSSSDFALPSYDIDPADQPLAAEIANFDPVFDVAGPTTIKGAVKLPDSIKATGLPPHLRDPIMAQLTNVPVDRRDAEETRLVNEALYQNSLGVRIVCGPGEGANAYQREKFSLTFDIEEAEREAIRLGTALGEIVRWDNVSDDATGTTKPVPVEKLQGEQRRAAETAHRLALRKVEQLQGIEGERRLQRALFTAVADSKAMTARLAERQDGMALGEQLARDERVKAIADAHAKRARTAL
jgi:hypothetical protein